MLFQVGKNFSNRLDLLNTTQRDTTLIRSVAVFSNSSLTSQDDLVIEYDYLIDTNNVGLVTAEPVARRDEVVLVLGDSLTEGQGATPWFTI